MKHIPPNDEIDMSMVGGDIHLYVVLPTKG